MGSDKNVLTVEPSPGTAPEELVQQLYGDRPFERWSDIYNGNAAVAGWARRWQPAKDRLFTVAESVDRAFLLHVHDSNMSSTGWFFDRQGDSLTAVEEVDGGEGWYGHDLVDYVKVEHDFDAVR